MTTRPCLLRCRGATEDGMRACPHREGCAKYRPGSADPVGPFIPPLTGRPCAAWVPV